MKSLFPIIFGMLVFGNLINCRSVVSSKSVNVNKPGINARTVQPNENAKVETERATVVIEPGTFEQTVFIEIKPVENVEDIQNQINKIFVETPIDVTTNDLEGKPVNNPSKEIIMTFIVSDRIPKHLLNVYAIEKENGTISLIPNQDLSISNRDDGNMNVTFKTKLVNAIFALVYDPGTLSFENVPVGISNQVKLNIKIKGENGFGFYWYKVISGSNSECVKKDGYQTEKIPINQEVMDDITSLPDGSITVCAFGEDLLGNSFDTTTAAFSTWNKDTKIPLLSSFFINEGNPEYTKTKTVSLVYEVDKAVEQYRLNAGTWTDLPENRKLSIDLLSYGSNEVSLQFKDAAGNESNILTDVIFLDETPPTLVVTSGEIYGQNTSKLLSGTAFDAGSGLASITISISNESGQKITETTISNSALLESWSFDLSSAITIDGYYVASFIVLDKAINSASFSHEFNWDSSVPSITSLQLDSGEVLTTKYMVKVDLVASDVKSNITHFCLKFNDITPPSQNSSCWISVQTAPPSSTPSKTLTLTNYDYMIGFIPGTYVVSAWVRDEANNVSSYVGTSGVDKKSIEYNPGTPPVITDVIVANSDAPANPPSTPDRTIGQGSDVYIKWHVHDDRVLPVSPISLYVTTNDSEYTVIAENVAYNNEAGCSINNATTTVDDNATGCYHWGGGSPNNGYFRIRVAAKDSNGMITFAPSSPINESQIDLWAGNTESGIGASASAAVFIDPRADINLGNQGTLTISSSGTFYIRDSARGILYISPSDGVLKILIPKNASLEPQGDGGPISLATVEYPQKIALDYQDRLLIYDHDRIRRVDTHADPMTIETIIGGGIKTDATVSPATDLNLSVSETVSLYQMTFTPLPDGRIFFQSDSSSDFIPANGFHLGRIYDPSNNEVRSINLDLTSVGNEGDTTTLIKNCGFRQNLGVSFNSDTSNINHMEAVLFHADTLAGCDAGGSIYYYKRVNLNPANYSSTGVVQPSGDIGWLGYTSYVTGRNGKLYTFNRFNAGAYKLNQDTGEWTRILGTGETGSCPDGTSATLCTIDPVDIFITADERIFFIERGKIRTIDSSGNVITIFGQGLTFGDEGSALSARFGEVNTIAQQSNGTVILLDSQEKRFREILPPSPVPPSLVIKHVAGNGVDKAPDTTNLALSQPIYVNWNGMQHSQFAINPANGNIFFKRGFNVSQLDRINGKWIDIAGGGSTIYSSGDGLTSIYYQYSPPLPIGFANNKVLTAIQGYDFIGLKTVASLLKFYDLSDSNRQSHFLGTAGDTPYTACADNTPVASCSTIYALYYSPHFIYDNLGGRARWVFHEPSTNAIRFVNDLTSTISTIASLPRSIVSFAPRFAANLATTNMLYYCASNGRLYQYDINTSIETPLTWPINSMLCGGTTLLYNSTNNSLIFPYRQNGLSGIAEYKL